jgi:hypothetical protein
MRETFSISCPQRIPFPHNLTLPTNKTNTRVLEGIIGRSYIIEPHPWNKSTHELATQSFNL